LLDTNTRNIITNPENALQISEFIGQDDDAICGAIPFFLEIASEKKPRRVKDIVATIPENDLDTYLYKHGKRHPPNV